MSFPQPLGKPTKSWPFVIVSLVVGALAPLGFSPFNIWPILLFVPAGLFLLIRNVPIKMAALRGFSFGLGFFGTGVSWVYVSIHQFGNAPIALAGLLTLLFVAFLSAVLFLPMASLWRFFCKNLKIELEISKILSFCAFWVLFEWLRSWLFTGFPWLYLGTGMLDSPLAPFAPVVGVYGMSLITTLSALTLAGLAVLPERKQLLKLFTFLVLVVGSSLFYLQDKSWTTTAGKPVRVSAIQANIPQEMKWDPAFVKQTWIRYLQLTKPYLNSDLIIWPENALPVVYPNTHIFVKQLQELAQKNNNHLIVGMPFMESRSTTRYPNFYNGMMDINADQLQPYYKQKLVPFGEYLPFASLLRGLIEFFNLPMSDFSKGPSNQPSLKVGPWLAAPYICFEVVYPDFGARHARGSNFLINISNDTWFGHSIGPQQHLQIARLMAAQTGRYLIRSTNNGISALINPKGQIVDRIDAFKAQVLSTELSPQQGSTPFMLYQSWPTLFLCCLLLGLAIGFRTGKQGLVRSIY